MGVATVIYGRLDLFNLKQKMQLGKKNVFLFSTDHPGNASSKIGGS